MPHDGTVSVYMNVAIKTFTTRKTSQTYYIPYRLAKKKFEYDSRLKADLIKFIKLNSTFLNFYHYFGIPESF